MSIARHHTEWLSLIEVSGPFLSIEVLMRAFSNGLPERESAPAALLRQAYEEWTEEGVTRHRAWIDYVLTEFLGWPKDLLTEDQRMPAGLEMLLPEHGEKLRPDCALVAPQHQANAGQPVLLVQIVPPGQRLDKPLQGANWKASPATRMSELLHATNVALGLVTNGEHWMLVYAPRGKTAGFATWQAALWLEEPITLRAFKALLETQRFFGVAETDTLSRLLQDSSNDQREVTDQLGRQVREAVEVLVQALDQIDQDGGRTLLKGVDERTLYEASLTVMMRLVFLFAAEERGLLLLGQPLYDDHYALSTLREQLQDAADRVGEEVLERRFDAWARFLATSRAVHGGITHQDLKLPPYGGSLFDPDRYPLLEGRPPGTRWSDTAAEPLKLSNRVVLHLLRSLQVLQTRLPGGGPAEPRRLSFRALDIEQIGHVYEGLLDHTALRATEPVLGLVGAAGQEPEIPLSALVAKRAEGEGDFVDYLKEETGKQSNALRRLLTQPPLIGAHQLLVACGNDEELAARIQPFAALLRSNSFGKVMVLPKGSVYVSAGTTRRDSSTYYTPRVLTESIVRHTLEPLVYQGPAQGLPRDQWRLRPPAELLHLKICDPAMGSGAFLVQACRYLSERLVESWSVVEKLHGQLAITPLGTVSKGDPSERLIPTDADERLALARRLVADQCLYGVDVNPLAVEMAKLSLWLITLQKNRPFTFVDHALKCGDSLLGISRMAQLEHFSLSDSQTQIPFEALNLWRHAEQAQQQRRELEALPSETSQQITAKQQLHAQAERLMLKLKCAADVLMALELKKLSERQYREQRDLASQQVQLHWTKSSEDEFRAYARTLLNGRRPFHWPLEFPELFEGDNGGFDAFVGNPPFKGGQKLTGLFGTDFRDYLVKVLAEGRRGSADLAAYFFLRAAQLLRPGGHFGLIAVNTIAEGDTRQVGLEALIRDNRYSIHHAEANRPWPSDAAVVVSLVHLYRGAWRGERQLNGQAAPTISAYLSDTEEWSPKPLAANAGKSFQGSIVLGMGFVVTEAEAHAWIAEDRRNAEVLFPFLNNDDLSGHPEQKASRWAINFWDWPEERARTYAKPYQRVLAQVKPERQRKDKDGNYELRRPLPERWWQYGEKRPTLYHAIGRGHAFENHPAGWNAGTKLLEKIICFATQASKHSIFELVHSNQTISHALGAVTSDSYHVLALLTSTVHHVWARKYGSTLENRLRYSPSDLFETYPFPGDNEELSVLGPIGKSYFEARTSLMLSLAIGLTDLYNRFHNRCDTNSDIDQLRSLHQQIDCAVANAYDWADLDLGHGFHEVPYLPENDRVRYTISEPARREVLRRLAQLNRERFAQEQTAVAEPHAPYNATPKRKKGKATATESPQGNLL